MAPGEEPVLRTIQAPVVTQRFQQRGGERDQAVLVAFTLDDVQQSLLAIDIFDPQGQHLAQA